MISHNQYISLLNLCWLLLSVTTRGQRLWTNFITSAPVVESITLSSTLILLPLKLISLQQKLIQGKMQFSFPWSWISISFTEKSRKKVAAENEKFNFYPANPASLSATFINFMQLEIRCCFILPTFANIAVISRLFLV